MSVSAWSVPGPLEFARQVHAVGAAFEAWTRAHRPRPERRRALEASLARLRQATQQAEARSASWWSARSELGYAVSAAMLHQAIGFVVSRGWVRRAVMSERRTRPMSAATCGDTVLDVRDVLEQAVQEVNASSVLRRRPKAVARRNALERVRTVTIGAERALVAVPASRKGAF